MHTRHQTKESRKGRIEKDDHVLLRLRSACYSQVCVSRWCRHLADVEQPAYSKKEIVEAGKTLSQKISEVNVKTLSAFQVAHNWRASYALPMNRVRHELRGKVLRNEGSGVTAARLKRMSSIRKKLAPGNRTLYQLQDIAGTRAILPDMASLDRVSKYFEDGDTLHSIVRLNDYIADPKPDGYRSKHIVLKFSGEGAEAVYSRQFVEIQLRTEKQHAWATAVEAVSLVRNEPMKSGEGSKDWLRFFNLMSAEIADRELQVTAKNAIRIEELKELDSTLGALKELQGYNQALKFTERVDARSGQFFLINFDLKSKAMSVSPYSMSKEGNAAYDAEERNVRGTNAVLVEVDRVHDLRATYPNYFLDVRKFVEECEVSLFGKKVFRFHEMDVSWVRNWKKPT